MEKFTKRQMYTAMINYAAGNDFTYATDEGAIITLTMDEIAAFAQNEVALLDKKAAKAKERAATKAKAPDEMAEAVYAALTDEFQTIADVSLVVAETIPDATVAKVSYRLNALTKDGRAVKEDIRVEDADGKKRTVKGFKLA